MKIGIVGAGGVGGYFGARLAAAGEDVWFIARGAHLDAMRQDGLQIHSANGDVLVKPCKATDRPAEVGTADIVIVAVKLWSTQAALADARPMVGAKTAVVSFQNGVVAADQIAQAYGRERTLGGVANIGAVIEKPGVIRHTGTMAGLTFGELDGKISPRVQALAEACTRAGIQHKASDDITKAIWEKYVFLVAASAMTSLTRLPLGAVREDPDTRALTGQVMAEAAAVGRAKGVELDADLPEKLLARMDTLPRQMVASMLGDLERGNRLELPWLSGGVVEMGRELRVATPANAFVYAALKHYVDGRPADVRQAKS
jgi:2-dehydropantoate 2-reductase